MAWRNWFLPHKDTHQKAHLISLEALFIYILLFIFLQVSFSIVNYSKPGLLGISSNIDQKLVIDLTNKEREKKGLGELKENGALDKAAKLKGENMFAENYWAHFAPSGKTPWDFILGSGYKFTYAGENLAKNFYSSPDVVVAWMNSPSHRENLLNSKYKDIGVAVVEGVLNGEKTTLVIQEFGTTEVVPAQQPVVSVSGKQVSIPTERFGQVPQLVASVESPSIPKPLFDPYLASKTAGVGVISLIVVLLCVDMVILKKRGVVRLSSHNIAHMAILSLAAGALIMAGPGAIL